MFRTYSVRHFKFDGDCDGDEDGDGTCERTFRILDFRLHRFI